MRYLWQHRGPRRLLIVGLGAGLAAAAVAFLAGFGDQATLATIGLGISAGVELASRMDA